MLFEALAALKITEDVYVVVNAYRDDGSLDVSIMEGIQTLQGQGWLVIGMGKKAQQALTLFGIPHRADDTSRSSGEDSPAELYHAHVAGVLKEQGP